MEYKEIIIDDKKYVTDEEGKQYLVFNNAEYGEFIYVDNKLNKDDEEPFNTLFTNRIKDAVDTIMNGDGDCIEVSNLFRECINVVHFLNRYIGEGIRERSLKGWKDAKFGWIVTCGSKKSLSGYSPLTKDGETISYFSTKKPIIFDTRDEAIKFINNIIDKTKEYASNYIEMANPVDDMEAKGKILNDIIDKIYNECGDFTIISLLLLDIIDDHLALKNDNFDLDEYEYKIEQISH